LEKVDGVIGPQTVGAIKAYQQSRGVAADGFPSKDVLRLLQGG
jgi:membrane-bound lytic murein transglycosylase B